MGCDYYIITYIKVEWEPQLMTKTDNIQTNNIQISKEGGYFCGSFDSDSEGDYDRKLDEHMNEIIKRNPPKILYENDNWKITSNYAISDYETVIKQKLITNYKLIKITKMTYCEERD